MTTLNRRRKYIVLDDVGDISSQNNSTSIHPNQLISACALFHKKDTAQGICAFEMKLRIKNLINPQNASISAKQQYIYHQVFVINSEKQLLDVFGTRMEIGLKRYKEKGMKIKHSILKHRHDTIINWLSNLSYNNLDGIKQDLLVLEKDIDSNFEEEAQRKKSFLEHEYEFFDREKIKNNERIIKKYINEKEFLDELLDLKKNNSYTISQLANNLPYKISIILKKMIGKEKYFRMKDEFFKNWEKGKTHGMGNAISHYIQELLQKNQPKQKVKISRKSKLCLYCKRKFYPFILAIDDSFNRYFPKDLNTLDIAFCSPCLKSAFLGEYKEEKCEKQMLKELKSLYNLLGYIPPSNLFNNAGFTRSLSVKDFNKVIPILIGLLPYSYDEHHYLSEQFKKNSYKAKFGSWFKALLKANILEGDVRKLPRGTMCLAVDGHQCLSIAEKNVDDWLSKHKIEHKKEIKYPKDDDLNPLGLLRSDWQLQDGTFVEFFGLKGNVDYDKKTELKVELCKKLDLKLIKIFHKDLHKLSDKFKNVRI